LSSRMKRTIKIVLAAGLGAGLLVAGFYAWILFFFVPDEPPEARIRPGDGTVVQRSRVMFRWLEADTPAWLFVLEDDEGEITYTQQVKGDQLVLPYGVLAPGRQFRWEVFRVDEDGEAWIHPEVSRRFSTAGAATTAGAVDPITLFPDRIRLTRENLVRGLAVEVRCRTTYTVTLPPELIFPDGEKQYEGIGPVILYPLFDLARARADSGQWGSVLVATRETRLQVPLVPDAHSLGAYVTAWDPGFQLYRDTPSFTNYSATWLSSLTQGTCVGIALVVKLFFERIRFGQRQGVAADHLTPLVLLEAMVSQKPLVFRYSASFRDLSTKNVALVTQLMSILHFENLNPLNLKETVFSVMKNREASVFPVVQQELADGKVAVLAGFRLREKVVKAPGGVRSLALLDSGHTFLVFRGWEFDNLSFYAVYDPNREYEMDSPGRTVLVHPKEEVPAYYEGSKRDRDMVRFMPMASSRIFTFVAITIESARELSGSILDSLQDFSSLFSF
jgi:hypothetical protein